MSKTSKCTEIIQIQYSVIQCICVKMVEIAVFKGFVYTVHNT